MLLFVLVEKSPFRFPEWMELTFRQGTIYEGILRTAKILKRIMCFWFFENTNKHLCEVPFNSLSRD